MILDMNFVLGLNLNKPISFNRICSLAYLYQISGVISNVSFKLPSKGISSSDIEKQLTGMLDKGYIVETHEGYTNTSYFNTYIDNYVLTNLEYTYLEDISKLISYTTEDLVYLCTVSILLDKLLQEEAYKNIDNLQQKLKNILSFMYPERDAEDLETAFSILNKLKEIRHEYQR